MCPSPSQPLFLGTCCPSRNQCTIMSQVNRCRKLRCYELPEVGVQLETQLSPIPCSRFSHFPLTLAFPMCCCGQKWQVQQKQNQRRTTNSQVCWRPAQAGPCVPPLQNSVPQPRSKTDDGTLSCRLVRRVVWDISG